MKIRILAFGVAKEILGSSAAEMDVETNTIKGLTSALIHSYPRLKQLSSFSIALNSEYAQPGNTIKEGDEVAIIPPVSGG